MRAVAVVAACLVASASAFSAPTLATRAVGKKAAKVEPSPTKRAPPASKGYPSIAESAQKVKWGNISGGGNRAPPAPWTPPDLSDPKLQIERDPEFYAAAAKTRLAKKSTDFVYEDGLTELERKQRATIPAFLTGSAKSVADAKSNTRDDVEVDSANLIFGLDPDRFQLLFIAVFGLFTLVGSLSGNLNL